MWHVLCIYINKCMNYIFRTRPSVSWKDLFVVYQNKFSPLFDWVPSESEGSPLFSVCTHAHALPVGAICSCYPLSAGGGWAAVDVEQGNLGFTPDLRTTALSICDFCIVLKGWQCVPVWYEEMVDGLEIFHSLMFFSWVLPVPLLISCSKKSKIFS